jgi:hypothetical protein
MMDTIYKSFLFGFTDGQIAGGNGQLQKKFPTFGQLLLFFSFLATLHRIIALLLFYCCIYP